MLTFRIFFIVLLFSFVFSSTLLVVSCCFCNMFFSAMSDLPDCVSAFFLHLLLSFQFLRVVRQRGNVGTVINPEFRGWQRTWIVCESARRLPMLEETKDLAKVDHLVDRHEDELLQLEEVLDRVIKFLTLVHSGLIMIETNLLRFRIFVEKSRTLRILVKKKIHETIHETLFIIKLHSAELFSF